MAAGCFAMHGGDAETGANRHWCRREDRRCAPRLVAHRRRQRNVPRHARLGRSECRLFGAGLAGQCEAEFGLRRHAEFAAHGVAEFYVKRRRLACVVQERPVKATTISADIADGIAAGAVGEPRRRRPKRGHRFDVLRAGEIERRRHAEVAGVAPICLPARVQSDFDSGARPLVVGRFDGRAGDEPRRGVKVSSPTAKRPAPTRRTAAEQQYRPPQSLFAELSCHAWIAL